MIPYTPLLLGLAIVPMVTLEASPATHTLFANQPAKNWSRECYPIGNGRLGAMSFGDVAKEVVQFNEQSLWSGDNNWNGGFQTGDHGFGNYRNFGDFTIEWRLPKGVAAATETATDYRRELDLATGIHTTRFIMGGTRFTRESLASHPDQALVFHYTADKPGSLAGRITLKSAQGAVTSAAGNSLRFAGSLPNTLRHAAELRIIPAGGKTRAEGDSLVFEDCNELTLLVDARTDYRPDFHAGWRTGIAPTPELDAAAKKDYAALRHAHLADFTPFMARAGIDLGNTAGDIAALPTAERRKNYSAGGGDPDLEELIFNYGRYLLVSSSRPGGLPANLQGLWCDSNNPPWASDYHSNINIEMNYWGAEAANLSECHEPLLDFFVAQADACRIATRKEFGDQTRGWTARTSQSIFGGNAWNWNIPSSAWYATHAFEHWSFTRDRGFLTKTAYPMLKEICQLWEDRLKARPDGSLVVPQGWSPEHGPTEDGVMHDQQLIWELFEDYLIAARELGMDAEYQKTIAGLQSRLAPNKIGKWGQLQEWQTDRDTPEDIHRHTSHLFAVFPGRQISVTKTPDLAKAATVSLLGRSGMFGKNKDLPFTAAATTGDSRQSWTWTWRCGMWARLNEGDKAGVMVRGLLTYNTHPNLFAFCGGGVYQIDGNLGVTGVMTEMLLQSHAGEIALLPAIPAEWAKAGAFKGLRARGGYAVDCTWQDGKVTTCRIVADKAPDKQRMVNVRVNGALGKVTPEPQ